MTFHLDIHSRSININFFDLTCGNIFSSQKDSELFPGGLQLTAHDEQRHYEYE